MESIVPRSLASSDPKLFEIFLVILFKCITFLNQILSKMKKKNVTMTKDTTVQISTDKQSHIRLKVVSDKERDFYRVPSYGYIL